MLSCNIVVREQNELYLDGVISFDNARDVMLLGCKLIDKLPIINVNLRDLKHSDSSGLVVISAWIRYTERQQKIIKIYQMPKFLSDLGKVSGLDQIFPVETFLISEKYSHE